MALAIKSARFAALPSRARCAGWAGHASPASSNMTPADPDVIAVNDLLARLRHRQEPGRSNDPCSHDRGPGSGKGRSNHRQIGVSSNRLRRSRLDPATSNCYRASASQDAGRRAGGRGDACKVSASGAMRRRPHLAMLARPTGKRGRMMKVAGLEVLRCDAGWRNYHFLKLTTDSGIVGWSEFDEGFGSPGISAVIERLSPRVVGQKVFDHERIYAELYCLTRPAAGGVVAEGLGAIENALLDAKAKALRRAVPCAARRQDPRPGPGLLVALRDLAHQPSESLQAGDHRSRRRQRDRRRGPRQRALAR